MYRLLICTLGTLFLCWEARGDICSLGSRGSRNLKYYNLLQPLLGKKFEIDDGNYTYKVGICAYVNESDHDVAALQIRKDGDKKSFILGKNTGVLVTGGNDWIMIEYYNGDNYSTHCGKLPRQVTIMAVCDETADKDTLEVLEENKESDANECYYMFELTTKVACTVTKPGMSGLEIFLLIFLIFVMVYFLLGFLYQRIVVGAQGLEQIPNYSAWKEFGKLIADGCDYICRCGDRHEAKEYRSIDDNLPPAISRDDRDDSMLNL